MNYFLKKKKWLAWVIMLTFLFTSFMPSNIMAGNSVAEAATTSSSQQVVNQGGNNNDESYQVFEDENLKIRKTIEGTDTENKFNISLEVVTTENLEAISSDPNAATILVMDCSGSMEGKRISNLKSAAKNFVAKFAKVPEGTTAIRNVAFVTFSNKAEWKGNWYNVTDATSKKNAEDALDDILYADGGTNIEGGLQLAKNIVIAEKNKLSSNTGAFYAGMKDGQPQTITNVNVILLTDGCPTYHVATADYFQYESKKWDKLSRYGLTVQKNREHATLIYGDRGGGDWAERVDYQPAEQLAGEVKSLQVGDENVNFYSIAFSAGTAYFQNKNNNDATKKSVFSWLQGLTGLGKTFNANNQDELFEVFEAINTLITLGIEAWKVEDPLGTDIVFDSANYSSEKDQFNTLIYDNTNNKLTWDLTASTPKKDELADGKTNYTYKVTYPVILDTSKVETVDGESKNTFDFNQTKVTNGITKLYYYLFSQVDEDDPQYGKLQDKTFNVPSVKGYAGSLNFTKKAAELSSKVLSGAKFKLEGTATGTGESVTLTATSGSDGKVSFVNIPAGVYTLTETKAPEDYVLDPTWKQTIIVSYGETYKDSVSETNKITDGAFGNVTNTLQTGAIQFNKVKDSGAALAGATFGLYSDADCTIPVKNKDNEAITAQSVNGIVKFENLEPKQYWIKEIDTTAPTNDGFVTIDEKIYTIDKNIYTAVVVAGSTVGIKATINDTSELANVVNHEQVTITGEKTWLDGNVNRPISITVGLFNGDTPVKDAQGKNVTMVVSPDASDNWSYTFTAPMYDAQGKKIETYNVKEIKVGDYNIKDGYAVDGSGNKLYQVTYDSNNITNTKLTTVKGQKIWQNSDLTAGWPAGATVTVGLYYQDGEKLVAVNGSNGQSLQGTLTSADDTFTFANLPQYDANGEITYVVKEESVKIGDNTPDTVTGNTITIGNDTYTVSGGTKGTDGKYNITNTLAGDADVIITKTWGTVNGLVNDHFDSISIKITGTAGTDKVERDYTIAKNSNGLTVTAESGTADLGNGDYTATINGEGDWKITFKNLPVANGEGVKYTYTVAETKIGDAAVSAGKANGYTVSVGSNNDPLHITNTPETATLKIKKEWVGGERGENVTFRIVGEIDSEDSPVIDKSVTVSKGTTGEWESSTTLPKQWQGEAITYTVGETNIPEGYEVSYKVNDEDATAKKVTWTPAGSDKSQSLWGAVINWITGQPSAVTEDTITVTATNTLQTADIQFTKSYSGGVLEGSKGNESEVTFAEFTLAADGENIEVKRQQNSNIYKTADGALKYGVVYTLSETTVPAGYTPMADKYLKLTKDTNGYKVVEYNADGEVLTGEEAKEYFVTNGVANLGTIVNNVIKGEFTFTKVFNSTVPEKVPTFTVYEATKNAGDNSYTTTETEVAGAVETPTVVANTGWTYKISNLECGKYYAVVEDNVTNYEPLTFYLSVESGANNTVNVTVVQTLVAGKENNSVWNNDNTVLTNTVKTAELTLTKTYDDKATNLIGDDTAVFTVYNDAAYTESPVMTVNSGYTFSNLECGKTYYVKETAPAGYYGVTFEIVVTEGANDAAVATIRNAVMLDANGNTTNIPASIDNNTLDNTIKITSFSFTKEYVGPQPEEFATFTVTADKDKTYSQTVSIADGKYTLSGLKFGYTYTVKENAPEGYVPAEFTVTVDTTGNVTATSKDATGKDVVTDANGTVVTNYLEQQKLSLKGILF